MCFLLLSGAPQKGLRAMTGAIASLEAEVRLKPYWDGLVHFDSSYTIVGHALRCLNNLVHAAGYIMALPLFIFSPLDLPFWPVVGGEHLIAASISAVAVVAQPIFFVIRTLMSMVFGYQENTQFDSNWDWGTEEEALSDWETALNPFIPSEYLSFA